MNIGSAFKRAVVRCAGWCGEEESLVKNASVYRGPVVTYPGALGRSGLAAVMLVGSAMASHSAAGPTTGYLAKERFSVVNNFKACPARAVTLATNWVDLETTKCDHSLIRRQRSIT